LRRSNGKNESIRHFRWDNHALELNVIDRKVTKDPGAPNDIFSIKTACERRALNQEDRPQLIDAPERRSISIELAEARPCHPAFEDERIGG
jgi:hypothetical protein